MFKFYAIITFAIAYGSFVSFATWQITTGKQAKKEVKIIATAVKDNNQDKIAIAEHITEVKIIEKEVIREIIKLKPIENYGVCFAVDANRLQRETYSNFPKMFFLRFDTMSSAVNAANIKP